MTSTWSTLEKATRIERVEFRQALDQGVIRALPEELHGQFVETYRKLYGGIYTPRPEAPVVYMPLCGCGLSTVRDEDLGFPLLSPPQEDP